MQKISFTVDGRKLAGAIFYPEKPKEKNPAILFVQGWTGEKERSYQYAEVLSKLGYICFLFDNLGHGESEGDIKKFTIKKFLSGVVGAFDYMTAIEGIDKTNISAVGSSFGSYLIALLSERREIKNLILRAPADYPNDNFVKSKYLKSRADTKESLVWRKIKKNPKDTIALNAINKFNGNILIIEAGKDRIIPHQTIENYLNAVKNKDKLTHVVINGAPHEIKEGRFRDEVTRILVDWFKTKI